MKKILGIILCVAVLLGILIDYNKSGLEQAEKRAAKKELMVSALVTLATQNPSVAISEAMEHYEIGDFTFKQFERVLRASGIEEAVKAFEKKHDVKFKKTWRWPIWSVRTSIYHHSTVKIVEVNYWLPVNQGQESKPWLKKKALKMVEGANYEIKELAGRYGFEVQYSVYFPIEGGGDSPCVPLHLKKI